MAARFPRMRVGNPFFSAGVGLVISENGVYRCPMALGLSSAGGLPSKNWGILPYTLAAW